MSLWIVFDETWNWSANSASFLCSQLKSAIVPHKLHDPATPALKSGCTDCAAP